MLVKRVMELVDMAVLKTADLTVVRVQVPSRLPVVWPLSKINYSMSLVSKTTY